MTEFTVAQVSRSIQRFMDYADDFINSDMNTYDDRSSMFFDFCKSDPVMCLIHNQLINNPNVNLKEWHENAISQMSSMAGSAPLRFPTDIDDRISLMYQLLLVMIFLIYLPLTP